MGTGTRPWAAKQGWGWEWGGLAMVMLTVASPPAGREETLALGTEAPGLLPQRLGLSWWLPERFLGDHGAPALLAGLDQTCGFMAMTGDLTSGRELEHTLPDVPLRDLPLSSVGPCFLPAAAGSGSEAFW